jgi:4-carboxymuconolactone decarboxylase
VTAPGRVLPLAPLAAAAAGGRSDAVERAAREAVSAGCTPDEIRETLLTVVPFCGFPRALDAFSAAHRVLAGTRHTADGAASPSRGAAFFDDVYGADAAKVRANLAALDGDVARWVESDAYGKVLSRPGIAPSVREMIGVVLLAAQGLRGQLPGHVRGALNCGATTAEVASFVDAASRFIVADELAFARETIARAGARA